MSDRVAQQEFVQQLTDAQHWLRAYLRALLRNNEQADELLQRTNLVMWEKSEQFKPGTNFRAWACKVARFEVLAFRKQQSRDRLVFGEAAFEVIAAEAERRVESDGDLRESLEACLGRLPNAEQKLLAMRYSSNTPVKEIARTSGRTVDAISTSLYRIRQALLKCIQDRIVTKRSIP